MPDNDPNRESEFNEFRVPGVKNWTGEGGRSRKERHDSIRRIVVYGALLLLAVLYMMLFVDFVFFAMSLERFTTAMGALAGLQAPIIAIAGYFFFRKNGSGPNGGNAVPG